MRLWLPLLVLAMISGVNVLPFDRGSIAFGSGEGFTSSRGWPFSAVAAANDRGANFVNTSVVQGDTRVSRNALAGPYPHLAWNPFFLFVDLIMAAVLVGVTYILAATFGKAAQQADVADRHPTAG